MSEYQYYEFQAVDRPLSPDELAELRALSTRAQITPTRFTNTYHWGDFKGDPRALMEEYFDAFVYVANWGTHRFMIRLPRALLDLRTVAPYLADEGMEAWEKGEYLVLEFLSQDEDMEWEEGDGEEWLPKLLPLRADLATGDLRALYLGWLAAAQLGLVEDDVREPSVPPGLAKLSAPLRSLAAFLRIDQDLLAVAAERSESAVPQQSTTAGLEAWIRGLPTVEKDALLLRLAEGREPHLRAELLRRFREASPTHGAPSAAGGGRTALELVDAAELRTTERERQQAEREAKERAARVLAAAQARARYLDELAPRQEETWRRIESLIDTKRPAEYDQAVQLLRDLRDLGGRMQSEPTFADRLADLRTRHARKPSLIERLDRARLAEGSAASSTR